MRCTICFLLLSLAFHAIGQKKSTSKSIKKLPLPNDIYDSWNTIPFKALTNDGNYAVYSINPQDGDGKVFIHSFKTNSKDSIARASDITVTYDNKNVVFRITPPKELVKSLRRQKKKKEDLPKDSLGLYTLAGKKLEKVPNVRSYKVPEKTGVWLAYQEEVKKEEKKIAPKGDTVKKTTPSRKKIKKNSDENGYTLVLRKFSDTTRISFGFVKDYLFPKYGKGLLFSTTGNDSTLKAGVYWYDLEKLSLTALYTGHPKFKYKGLAASEDGTQVSFLADQDTTKAQIRFVKLYHWNRGEPTASLLADEKSDGIPQDWIVNDNYGINFSKDGSKLYLGISPKPVVPDTMKLDEEIVKVEVWTWKDDVLYPQQTKETARELKRTYLAAIHLKTKKLTALADTTVPTVTVADEGNSAIALGVSDLPYRWSNFYDVSGHRDGYVINLADGSRKKVAEKIKGDILISPKANYLFWFNLADTAWFTYNINNNRTTEISQSTGVSFADEENDVPSYPEPYGFVGWTADDKQLLVYDRYDIWSLDPQSERKPINLTGIGRPEKTIFRYVSLDPEEKFIKADAEILLEAFNETTKEGGFYKLSLKSGELKKLFMTAHHYGSVVKAKDHDRILFTRENFKEFPDFWTSSLSFNSPKKITTANPQMKKYLWGSVELVKWNSIDGVPLEGLLYKPENFDPKKKYPMIVYFYEKSSDQMNFHYPPTPSRSTVHRTVFSSNGYLIFIPNIVYKTGFPGESAYNCVMPGVTSMIGKGFVDEKNIGVQGQSWGGYQAAYLITRTNIFKAAGAGAPVVNMTSAYGGIRWGTGYSRMFQYEQTQSRIGGTLWERPLYYIENSPLFFAEKIQTPLLMTHNDEDGAVPWYQGIEFYMALRRLQKPVWLLVYNKEDHNLTQWQNRKDLSIRLSQFFDHYLKGTPAPPWMEKGVPATEKGITTGY